MQETCTASDVPPPAQRKVRKARMDYEEQATVCKTKDDYHRAVLTPLVTNMVSELNRRFNEETSVLYYGVSALTPIHSLFLNAEHLKAFGVTYGLKEEDIADELKILRKLFERKFTTDDEEKPKNLCEFHKFLQVYKKLFLNINKLCTISITLSISSAGCERSFSAMKRIKSYNRSTMSNMRLCNLAVLHVGNERLMNIKLDDVVDKFAKNDNRRIVLF